MEIVSDCTGTRKYVRVKDLIDQTWEVWCETGGAHWAGQPASPDDPERWVVQSPDGAMERIDMDGVLTKATLLNKLSFLLGDEETADTVLRLFDPLHLDSDGVINPAVYVPSDCR